MDNIYSIAINSVTTFSAALVAVFLANKFAKRNEKRNLTFILLERFNSADFHNQRVLADRVSIRNETNREFKDYSELIKKDILDKTSIFIVAEFYKYLWELIQHDKIDNELAFPLFGDIFCYWWINGFEEFLVRNNNGTRDLANKLSSLHSFFEVQVGTKTLEELKTSKLRKLPTT